LSVNDFPVREVHDVIKSVNRSQRQRLQLMHRKRLMIGKFPDDARWRADDAMASALITCHDE
jgi:hypothetical protein